MKRESHGAKEGTDALGVKPETRDKTASKTPVKARRNQIFFWPKQKVLKKRKTPRGGKKEEW